MPFKMVTGQEIDAAVSSDEKIFNWRLKQLLRLWPDYPIERAKEISHRYNDPFMLETARRLNADECPWQLAHDILL